MCLRWLACVALCLARSAAEDDQLPAHDQQHGPSNNDLRHIADSVYADLSKDDPAGTHDQQHGPSNDDLWHIADSVYADLTKDDPAGASTPSASSAGGGTAGSQGHSANVGGIMGVGIDAGIDAAGNAAAAGAAAGAEEAMKGLVLLTELAYAAGTLLFAAIYQALVTAKKPEWRGAEASGFRTGIKEECASACGCLACQCPPCVETSLCLHAWCCPTVLAADTYASVGLNSFYCNFLAAAVLANLPMVIMWIFAAPGEWDWAASLVGKVLWALWFVGQRGQLRGRLGAEGSCADDCCRLLFCTPCSLSQEARHVNDALGVGVECCCALRAPGAPVDVQEGKLPLVGQPAGVQGPGL